MKINVEFSTGGGFDGPWESVGSADVEGDDPEFAAVREVSETAGLFRLTPEAAPTEHHYCVQFVDGRMEHRTLY